MKKFLAPILLLLFCCASTAFAYLPAFSANPLKINNGAFTVYDLYVAQNNHVYLVTSDGIFENSDQGKTWLKIPQGDLSEIQQIVTDQNKLIVHAEYHGQDSIFVSSDNGQTWKNITPPNGNDFNSLAIHHHTLYVGGDAVIYQTNDQNINWTNDIKCRYYSMITSIFATDKAIYFGSQSNFQHVGLFRAMNGAVNNFKVDSTAEEEAIYDIYISQNRAYVISDHQLFIASLDDLTKFQPVSTIQGAQKLFGQSDDIFVASDNGVYESSDGGITWKQLTNMPKIRRVAFANQTIYITDQNGDLYVSTDHGQSWHNVDYALNIHAIKQDIQGHFYTATSNGIRISDDQGQTWQSSLLGHDINDVAIDQTNNNRLYAITNQTLYQSTDNGKNWKDIFALPQENDLMLSVAANNGNIVVSTQGAIYTKLSNKTQFKKVMDTYDAESLFFDNDNKSFYLVNVNTISQSQDQGTTWSRLYQAQYSQNYNIVYADQSSIYAGGSNGVETASLSQPLQWDTLTGTNNWNVQDIIGNAHSMFVVHDKQLSYSNDQGKTWTTIPTPFFVTSILQTKDNTLYAGSADAGLYVSHDNGNTWNRVV